MNTRLFPVLIATALGLTLAACSKDESAAPVARKTVAAATITVQAADADQYSVAPGTVMAVQSVQVASRLMGYLRNIDVVEGQAVKAGQRLFTIDPTDVEGGVAQARQGMDQAEKALQDAKADYERFGALYKDEAVTRQQYEKMKLNYEISASRAAQARAGLASAENQLRYAVVTSPIDGVVTQKFANAGDIAAPGHPIVMVENAGQLQVQTSVSEEVYATLAVGGPVKVEVHGLAGTLDGRIARVSPAADPMAHTHLVKIDVAGKGLRSGAFARVLFPGSRAPVLRVPAEAVLNRAGIIGVFVVNGQGIAEYRMVRTGATRDGQTEILSGLASGERVVTRNAAALSNGDAIRE